MNFLEKVQSAFNSLLEHPYAKPALIAMIVLVVLYYVRMRSSNQYGGADEQHPPALTESHVKQEVTDESGSNATKVPQKAVVLFYSNHCGHCQVLMPTWDGLAAKYNGNPNVMLDKVDCEQDKAAGEQFKIEGYPTILKLGSDGSKEVYNGPRDANSLEKFIAA